MYFITSDGKEYWKADSCGHCSLNTAGEHEWDCPIAIMERGYKLLSDENAEMAEALLSVGIENW